MFVDVFVCGSVSVSLFASVMSDIICLGACVGVWHQSVGLCLSVCVFLRVVCVSASCVPVSVALCLCLAITRCLSWAQLSPVERGHGLRLLHLHLQLLMPQSVIWWQWIIVAASLDVTTSLHVTTSLSLAPVSAEPANERRPPSVAADTGGGQSVSDCVSDSV